MELSRQEYPALLSSLQPHEAVSVMNERVKLFGRINLDIADWLSERRRVEEAYVLGLKKLASRKQQDGALGLGIFQAPWHKIVSSTGALAESHSALAQRIEADVERPLREFQIKNREMQAMSTIQGNLTSIAKDLEEAQKKADKINAKGGKAAASKVSSAASGVESARQQWDSQAPYVFEQLQALDEGRVNHLRDVLTQFQTHEVDQVERNRITAESCLNELLNVNTGEEISGFVARISGGRPTTATPPQPRAPTLNKNTVPQTPPRTADDGRSEKSAVSGGPGRSSFAQDQRKSGIGGLKRLGTVMGRRKQETNPPPPVPTPDKRTKQSRNPLRRGSSARNMQQIPSPDVSTTELPLSSFRQESSTNRDLPRVSETNGILPEEKAVREELNGDSATPAFQIPSLPNGNQTSHASMEPQQLPVDSIESKPEGEKQTELDSDGFSVPPPAMDDISRAQQEAASESDSANPQFKLDIRNEPIHEEDGDAQTALSNVANTLRAQAQQLPPQRKLGTTRGRRDVRNTIFVPNPQTPESQPMLENSMSPASPFNNLRTNFLNSENAQGSDAQSIRSAHSLNSLSSSAIKHPDMNQPGLNASIVETVSAWFSNGQVTKAAVIGELALAYNEPEHNANSGAEVIRLENFQVLEKVAPNPTFIDQLPSRMGEYTINLAQLARTSVAFKYQVHLEEATLAAYAPVMLSPNWRVEPTQTSVMLSYSFNPAFVSAAKRSVSLQNVVIAITIENAKATSCLSKPSGHFSKDKSLIYWRLGDITLDAYAEQPRKLLARFVTDGEAKPGNIEARWEIGGEHATGLGGGLSLSRTHITKEEGADPFADEGSGQTAGGAFKEVPVLRKLISGKYVAN